jgi:hypothetical protein
MSFDPNLPQEGTPLDAVQMRSQLNGLKAIIDASLTAAQVDGVNTVEPGNPANASVSVTGNTLHFTFGIPRGNDGSNGSNGSDGAQGPPGEISQAQLNSAINGTSNNMNGVSTLDSSFADPDMEALRQKVNEMILNGRR